MPASRYTLRYWSATPIASSTTAGAKSAGDTRCNARPMRAAVAIRAGKNPIATLIGPFALLRAVVTPATAAGIQTSSSSLLATALSRSKKMKTTGPSRAKQVT